MCQAELKVVDEIVITAADAAKMTFKEGPAAAMLRFNRKPEPPVGT
jgi:hypothetical protein